MLYFKSLIMEVERKKRMRASNLLNFVWLMVGVLLVGGIYCLSYNNIDQAVVSESKHFAEFVKTVLK